MKNLIIRQLLLCLLLLALCSIPALAEGSVTYLLYASGENLENPVQTEIDELIASGLGAQFNICVMVGGSGSWNSGENYLENGVVHSLVLGGEGIASDQSMGNPSMAASTTLTDFIVSSLQNYPAEHIILNLYDHGAGAAAGLMVDSNYPGQSLQAADLERALRRAQSALGTSLHFDMVILHGCMMSNVEFAAALQPYSSTLISSEDLLTANTLTSVNLLNILSSGPDTDPQSLAIAFAQTYSSEEEGSAISAIDLDRLPDFIRPLSDAMEQVAHQLTPENTLDLSRARDRLHDRSSKSEDMTPDAVTWDMVDMQDLFYTCSSFFSVDFSDAEQRYNDIILYNSGGTYNGTGLGVFFPNKLLNYNLEQRFPGYFTGLIPGLDDFVRQYASYKEGKGPVLSNPTASQFTGDRPDQNEAHVESLSSAPVPGSRDPWEFPSSGTSSLISQDTESTGQPDPGISSSSVISQDSGSSAAPDQGSGVSSLISQDSGSTEAPAQSSGTSSLVSQEDVPTESSGSPSEDHTFGFSYSMSHSEMDYFSYADGFLLVSSQKEPSNPFLFLGPVDDILVDWMECTVYGYVPSLWPKLNDQMVSISSRQEIPEGILFLVPAKINDRRATLEVLFPTGSGTGQVRRCTSDETGGGPQPQEEIPLKEGDHVQLRYPLWTLDENGTSAPQTEERISKPFSWEGSLHFELKPLDSRMPYCFMFCHTDVYGQSTFLKPTALWD